MFLIQKWIGVFDTWEFCRNCNANFERSWHFIGSLCLINLPIRKSGKVLGFFCPIRNLVAQPPFFWIYFERSHFCCRIHRCCWKNSACKANTWNRLCYGCILATKRQPYFFIPNNCKSFCIQPCTKNAHIFTNIRELKTCKLHNDFQFLQLDYLHTISYCMAWPKKNIFARLCCSMSATLKLSSASSVTIVYDCISVYFMYKRSFWLYFYP